MSSVRRLRCWALCLALAVVADAESDALLQEIQRLRQEVEKLKTAPPQQPPPQVPPQQQPGLDVAAVQRELEALRGALAGVQGVAQPAAQGYAPPVSGYGGVPGMGAAPGMGAMGAGMAAPGYGAGAANGFGAMGTIPGGALGAAGLGGFPAGAGMQAAAGAAHQGYGLAGGLGAGTAKQPDACMSNPLFSTLHGALQKLALLEQDPVEASYQIHAAWEENPDLFDECPVGLITALVYLSIAQEREWKYRLLHRATYLLYSTPGLSVKMARGKWPMSDRLIRTMYHNSEVIGRSPLKFGDAVAQPQGATQPSMDSGIDEAVGLSLRHRDTVKVHFGRILFYHFYHEESSPCACRTRSWCLAHWMRHFTNQTVDVWLAGRDEKKTLYRMDRSGCMRPTASSLADHHIAEAFDMVFVFEINALMHPQCRVIPARRILLYPTFDLAEDQMSNFEDLGVTVLPDDGLLKPPNPAFRQSLEDATNNRKARLQRPKDRLLLFPADIRPMKGQTEFLTGLLTSQARFPASLQRLRGLTIVVAGTCDGNQTYCAEVVALTQQVSAEGLINVVVADQLKDEELSQLYAAALGVVLYSKVDCNPRAVYEGLVTDTPFFVTERTRLPALIQHLGHVSDGDVLALPDQLADFVDFSEAGGFAGRPRDFAQRHMTEPETYRKVIEWMDAQYLNGKSLDPVIKSEDALSKAFGGLGGALGGGGGGGGMASLLGELGRRVGADSSSM